MITSSYNLTQLAYFRIGCLTQSMVPYLQQSFYCSLQIYNSILTYLNNYRCCVPLGEHLDILAVSCDSFDPETNALIGRQQGSKDHLQCLHRVRDWCLQYKVQKLKIITHCQTSFLCVVTNCFDQRGLYIIRQLTHSGIAFPSRENTLWESIFFQEFQPFLKVLLTTTDFGVYLIVYRVAIAEWLARRTPNHEIVGSSLAYRSLLIKKRPDGLRVTTMVPRFTQP